MNDYQRSYLKLNELQKKCVDTPEGPLLILAGPGTGKTELLSVRAGAIAGQKRAEPENILILTYTNSAAKAMKERLAKVMGQSGYDVEVSTFHGFANSIIQESEEASGYVGNKIQLSDVERMRVMEYILNNTDGLEDIRPFGAPYTYLKEILENISRLKRDGIKANDLKKYLSSKKALYHEMEEKYRNRLKAFSVVYEKYEELKEGRDRNIFDERGRYDFDDMIIYATQALKKEGLLKKEYQERFKYAMVDEYQDTNGSQLELLFSLFDQSSPNLCFVGDDDQSIYRFQGASVDNFNLLEKRFPDLKTINLKKNYRSSKDLIDISRSVINMIPVSERTSDKPLEATRNYRDKQVLFREFTTEEEELLFLVDKVRELKERIEADKDAGEEDRKHSYNNIAILVRKRKDILKVIDAFLQAGIPYATDGKEDIAGEKRVRQLLDALDLVNIDPSDTAPKDLALYKVISSDYFRLDHSDILKFLNAVNLLKKTDPSVTFLGEFLAYAKGSKPPADFSDEKSMLKTAGIIKKLLEDADTKSVHSILTDFLKDSGLYRYVLERYSDKGILRIRQLRALGSFINMVKTSDLSNPSIRLRDFMLEMKIREEHALPVQGDLVTMTQEGVRIYTAHGSKGLEFRSVIIPFCLHNRNWPARMWPERIKLPPDLINTGRRLPDGKEKTKELSLQDETRLFYVAMTRAKSDLIFTASPTENNISSLYLSKLEIERESPASGSQGDEETVIEKSIEVTDIEDPFIGTEDILRDMVGNMSLNPTRLNAYIYCKRRFLYNDVIKLPGAKKKSLIFGNCVHKALEDTYREFMAAKKFPLFSFFQDAFRRELKFQGVDRASERELLEKMEKTAGWFEKARKAPVMPLSLEKKLLVTIGDNILFTGKYDKVEWHDEKKKLIKIIDYKTGKPDKHLKAIGDKSDITDPECDGYLRQLVGYRLLFERDKSRSKGRRVASGELVFIEPVSEDMKKLGYSKGSYAVKSVEITDDMVNKLEGLIKTSWEAIKRLKFEKLPVRDDNKCGHCDFDPICWGGDDE